MDLAKENWCENDKKEFIEYLKTFKRDEKIEWTKNILNTKMEVLAIKAPEINILVKEIKKGNYLSFLDLNINDFYECVAINGKLISGIKDFKVMRKYLDEYSKEAENWAVCDLLKFNIKNKEAEFFQLSQEYVNSELPFVRRIGMIILFNFIDNDEYLDNVYDMLNKFCDEKEYYVNMVNAWLLCELFIKRRDKTIVFLENNSLNSFTINKCISKCCDSFRISASDKEMLLKFRTKM